MNQHTSISLEGRLRSSASHADTVRRDELSGDGVAVGSSTSAGGALNLRDRSEFQRAKRHSARVHTLRRVLPIVAVLLVVTVSAAAILFSVSLPEGVSVERIGIAGGKLVMDKPDLNGFDKNNRPFEVRAATATQDLKNPAIIQLKEIDARLPLSESTFADVDALTGIYDRDNERLQLNKDIRVKNSDGLEILLEKADIDMKSGTLVSDRPVSVKSGRTQVRSDRLEVQDNGKLIIFEHRVRMVIEPANDKPDTKGSTSDG